MPWLKGGLRVPIEADKSVAPKGRTKNSCKDRRVVKREVRHWSKVCSPLLSNRSCSVYCLSNFPILLFTLLYRPTKRCLLAQLARDPHVAYSYLTENNDANKNTPPILPSLLPTTIRIWSSGQTKIIRNVAARRAEVYDVSWTGLQE